MILLARNKKVVILNNNTITLVMLQDYYERSFSLIK